MIEKLDRTDARILVVEDEDMTRSLLVKLLNVMGAKEVFEAKDGGQGLAIACARKPDLVVCDLHMMPVDGLSMLGGLRESCDADVRAIKVVMFTADKDGEPMRRARRIGVSGYVSKPFNPKGFSAVVKTALGETVGQTAEAPSKDPRPRRPSHRFKLLPTADNPMESFNRSSGEPFGKSAAGPVGGNPSGTLRSRPSSNSLKQWLALRLRGRSHGSFHGHLQEWGG